MNKEIKDVNMKKIIVMSGAVILFLLFSIFTYKKIKSGNNESNKSAEQIQEYILNMNSYTAEMEVTVNSNKNKNKYLIKQENKRGKYSKQTVLKPENIEGTEFEFKDNSLIINNSRLNISKVYDEYPYIADNVLWLSSFIEEYKNSSSSDKKIYEKNEEIVLEVISKENKRFKKRRLYVEKGTGKPKRMEILDSNNKCTIYISYNEISISE